MTKLLKKKKKDNFIDVFTHSSPLNVLLHALSSNPSLTQTHTNIHTQGQQKNAYDKRLKCNDKTETMNKKFI